MDKREKKKTDTRHKLTAGIPLNSRVQIPINITDISEHKRHQRKVQTVLKCTDTSDSTDTGEHNRNK